MAKSSTTLLAMLLVLSATVAQIRSAAAEEAAAITDLGKCWSFIITIPGCVKEIIDTIQGGGKFGKIGPACCSAINHVSQDCWPDMFPFIPFLDKLLKGLCKASAAGQGDDAGASETALTSGIDVAAFTGCWSSITSIEGCAEEVIKSLVDGPESRAIGPACCKSTAGVSGKCWPKMFPSNPLFPPFLKSSCAGQLARPKPTPAAA